MIPISKPDIGPAEEEAVLEVLRSGMLAMGKKTEAFEQAWAAYCGVRHAIFMANGTLAQEAVLHALGIGARRRGHHGQFQLQRHGQRHPAHRGAPGLRRHPGRGLRDGPGPRGGRHHAPHEGDHAGPPVRAHGRHGPAGGDRRAARADDRGGCGPGPRRGVSRPREPGSSGRRCSARTPRRTS